MSDLYDLGLVELVSRSTCQIKWQNSYIYYRSTISTFNVMQRSTQGHTKMLYIMHLTVLVLFIYGYGVYWKHFQTYFMYVLYFSPWRNCCNWVITGLYNLDFGIMMWGPSSYLTILCTKYILNKPDITFTAMAYITMDYSTCM